MATSSKGVFHIDAQGLDQYRHLAASVPQVAKKALNLAIGRALEAGKTTAIRETTARFTLKSSRIRKTLKVTRPGRNKPEGELKASSTRVTLSSYRISPRRETTGAKRTPLRAEVRRTGLKPLGRAFLHSINGNLLPFRRVGKERMPLEVLYGPSPTEAMSDSEITEKVTETLNETTSKRFIHELDRLLGKQNARK